MKELIQVQVLLEVVKIQHYKILVKVNINYK